MVARLQEVHLGVSSFDRFRPVLGDDVVTAALGEAQKLKDRLGGRVIWNVNSTAVGGGVAEMLQPLLGYTRGVGIDTRWIVIDGNPEFFALTKRIHHALHGSRGDGRALGDEARRLYESTLHDNAVELKSMVGRGDFVILHDPQTAGLAPDLIRAGAHVIWRCHIGHDRPSPEVDEGWAFLAPYLKDVPAFVFSRAAYVPDMLDGGRSRIIQPSIDPFSAKNGELSESAVRTILVNTGLVEGPPPEPADPCFMRADGSPSRVERAADVARLGRAPAWDAPLVVQVSRWDPLKDMLGVMAGFCQLVVEGLRGPAAQAALVLAGPNVRAVADDPEGPMVYEGVAAAWRALPHAVRRRVHLAMLPTQDVEENAAIVNALQRHATIVVQKSLNEGFGLTVTEAMWKARPVVASAVGGIQDQIVDGECGVLIRDPRDTDEFAGALRGLLEDPERAGRLGAAAKEHARKNFLGIRHLLQYAALIAQLDDA